MTTIRIPLDDAHCTRTPARLPELPDLPDLPGEPQQPEIPSLTLRPTLVFEDATVPDYNDNRFVHPVAEMSFTFPDADGDTVRSWFEFTGSQVAAPSETLVNRVTTSLFDTMDRYYTAASRLQLFTRPFRLRLSLRMKSGIIYPVSEPVTVFPNFRSPIAAIRSHSLVGHSLSARTEIFNTPKQLLVDLPPFTLPDQWKADAEAVDIEVSLQNNMRAGDERVTGVRTYEYFGENLRCWHYTRLGEALVAERTGRDTPFRILESIPIEEALHGFSGRRVPSRVMDLDDPAAYPVYQHESGGNTSPGNDPTAGENNGSETFCPDFTIETLPLDLGDPDGRKRIRRVSLRGVFPRYPATPPGMDATLDEPSVEVGLYGAAHRPDTPEGWHLLAKTPGPHITALRSLPCRWFMVRAKARNFGSSHRIDAISISFSK